MPEVLHTDVPSIVKQDFAEIARRHNRSLAGELRQAVSMWVRAHAPADDPAGALEVPEGSTPPLAPARGLM
jgi:hypothetical protein